ncbi:hypothetical protein [Sphingomonas sp.]|uniref:hypothetical protein n=1 Tax=Sphingomonas sp. TaxID=28214 RepID=UPI0026001F2C|nr:hypothetical protein [Sphingomonas sp.]MBV9529454.1 hypothetical protein [Sphingomonas sp.]
MTDDHLDYFRRRERQERALAKTAPSVDARRTHQQAAEHYAWVVHGSRGLDPAPLWRAVGLL